MADYSNRRFMIFNVSELGDVDFSQVLETSADTVRKSVDETKTFVKWNYQSTTNDEGVTTEIIPSSVDALTTKEGPYTYSEILTILATPEWTDPDPEE
tara:strand:+ start:1415 stop:1708 length:294 start_codon:yes stop_codon:yes gene_type:complete